MKAPTETPLVRKTIATLFQHRAENIVLIDLRKFKALLDDVLLICTCQSEIQMRSLLKKCETVCRSAGSGQTRVEYSTGVKWGILKSEFFILHIFEKETRDYYSLERLWGDAAITELSEEDFSDVIEITSDLEGEDWPADDSNEFL